jgi:aspartate aminotransferase-like enzyme
MAVLLLFSTVARGEGVPATAASPAVLNQIAAELRELKREFLEDRIERQEARVSALERELQRAHFDLQSGDDSQRTESQDAMQLDQQLSDPALSPEQRAELEAVRTEVAATAQRERSAQRQRESETAESLHHERARLESLRGALRALSALPPSTSGQ